MGGEKIKREEERSNERGTVDEEELELKERRVIIRVPSTKGVRNE